MNKKLSFLTRQVVYAFLIGLISGGICIGLLDAYAKQPMFSRAFMSGPNTFFCVSQSNPNESCIENMNQISPQSGYNTDVSGYDTTVEQVGGAEDPQ
jgi:hypothetical protein